MSYKRSLFVSLVILILFSMFCTRPFLASAKSGLDLEYALSQQGGGSIAKKGFEEERLVQPGVDQGASLSQNESEQSPASAETTPIPPLSVNDFFLTEEELPSPWIPDPDVYAPELHMQVKEKLMGGDWWAVRIRDQEMTTALHVIIGLFPTEVEAMKYTDPDTFIFHTNAYDQTGETFTEMLEAKNSDWTLSGPSPYGDGGFSGGYQSNNYWPFHVFRVGRVLFHTDSYSESDIGILEPLLVEKARGLLAQTEQDVEETPTAESTESPPTTPVVLKAYLEGKEETFQTLEVNQSWGSVIFEGIVQDQQGDPVPGAIIEVVSGANLVGIKADQDGTYSLSTVVPGGGGDSGQIRGVDFTLQPKKELTIEIRPEETELHADGTSTTEIIILAKDLAGNPLEEREFTLDLDGEVGPGTIQPALATTDESGRIRATYTAFKLAPGPEPENPRHEISISARDSKTGLISSDSLFVSQYQLTVLGEEYIPACTRCNFPAKIKVMVTDYWSNPIPDLALSVRLEGGTPGGTLVLNPASNAQQSDLQLNTDREGVAEVYVKWLGRVDLKEALQEVVIMEGGTQVQARKTIKVHGLDLALARVEEAGFTGVTGQQAFFKIYFKDLAHPSLPLDRFNAESPNKLGLRVTIRQYHSDGENKSLTFEQTGSWGQDEKGTFVEMYGTPRMPSVIPRNDGTSWYEVRVDPVVDDDVFLPDLHRANNDTIMAITTGSPDGWLHIWLQDGVLTPHSYTGVIFKCVGRFLPGLGDAMTVIDTLNQVYKLDALGLGQSTSALISEKLQKKSASKTLTKYKAGTINNVLSCVQDTVAVYGEKNRGSSLSGKVCAALSIPLHHAGSASDAVEEKSALDKGPLDRFVQGMLLDSPDQLGLVVYGLESSQVTLTDDSGKSVEDPDRMSSGGQVVVYILPADQDFQLEVESDQPFEVGIYSAGSDPAQRTTIRQDVDPQTALTARMEIGGGADYTLDLDRDGDGTADQIQDPDVMTLDVVKPEITELSPPNGASVSSFGGIIQVRYRDNTGGDGIDPGAILINVDGQDLTAQADIESDNLSLPISDLDPGEHSARLVVVDKAGNAVVEEWSFKVSAGYTIPPEVHNLVLAVGAGLAGITLLAAAFAVYRILKPRKKGSDVDSQDKVVEKDGTQKVDQPPKTRSARRRSWVIALAAGSLIVLLVVGGISLAAFQFLPGIRLTMGTGDTTKILQQGGGGLLALVLGFFLIRGGFKAILTRRVVIDDEYGGRREKRGCSAVLNGLVQLFFGIVILTGGAGLMALVMYQEVLPFLGF